MVSKTTIWTTYTTTWKKISITINIQKVYIIHLFSYIFCFLGYLQLESILLIEMNWNIENTVWVRCQTNTQSSYKLI